MTEPEFESDYLLRSIDFQPWLTRTKEVLEEQEIVHKVLARRAGAKIGKNVYIAARANVFTSYLSIGDNSIVTAGAILRGHIKIGPNCTVNPYTHIAGLVSIGSGVRIAGMSALYGFNHGFKSVDEPIFAQAHTIKGIEVGDDVWIGTNAVILDGCKIGSHSIVAAGAVVTRSFSEYSIIAGNPARRVRDRRENAPDQGST